MAAQAAVDLTFFATFFTSLDDVLKAFVHEGVVNMSNYVKTAVRPFGIFVLIITAIELMWAPFAGAFVKYGKTLALIAFVSNVALIPANYNAIIGDFLLALPDDLLTAMDPQGVGAGGEVISNIGQYLDAKIGRILNGIIRMWGRVGMTDFGGALLSIVMFVICCLLAVNAVVAITVGKVGMALVVAIGPLVVLSLISTASRDFFTKWISYAMMLAMLQLLIGGVLLISDKVLTTYGAVFMGEANPTNMAGMFAPAVAMFVLTYIFSQLPSIASSITGGIGIATGNFAWDTMNRERSMPKRSGGGGSGGGTVSKNSGGGGGQAPAGGGTVSEGSGSQAQNAIMRAQRTQAQGDKSPPKDAPQSPAQRSSGSAAAWNKMQAEIKKLENDDKGNKK